MAEPPKPASEQGPEIRTMSKAAGRIFITVAMILSIALAFGAAYIVTEFGQDNSVTREIQAPVDSERAAADSLDTP